MDLKKVWDEKGYGKDNPFENTVRFLYKNAEELKLPAETVDNIVMEVMFEVDNGKEYSQDQCPCGCGIDKSGTAITHEMLVRLLKVGDTIKEAENKILTDRLNGVIKKYEKGKRFWNKPLSKLFKRNTEAV